MTYATALLWLRTNWQGLVAGFLLAAAVFLIRGNPEPQVIATATASTAIQGGATAHSGATIEIPGRKAAPCPPDKICPECPAVRVVYDCGASVSGSAGSGVTATVAVSPSGGLPISLALGAGYRSDSSYEGILQARVGDLSVDAASNPAWAWRLSATYKVWGFK